MIIQARPLHFFVVLEPQTCNGATWSSTDATVLIRFVDGDTLPTLADANVGIETTDATIAAKTTFFMIISYRLLLSSKLSFIEVKDLKIKVNTIFLTFFVTDVCTYRESIKING